MTLESTAKEGFGERYSLIFEGEEESLFGYLYVSYRQ